MATLTASNSVILDRTLIEANLSAVLPPDTTSVGRAIRYAVLGPGQRLRPILALRTARVLGSDPVLALRAANAVELLHCASLIVDDLPCMDNDALRRNRPSLHVEFGEATAVLAAFALVALAAKLAADRNCFQLKLLSTLDCNSLIGGQALDLELSGSSRETHRSYVTDLKTVPLFQLAVEAGIVCPTVHPAERDAVVAFGREFGVCYQMVDDCLDGEVANIDAVCEQLHRTRACLTPVASRAHDLEDLLDYLNAKLKAGCPDLL